MSVIMPLPFYDATKKDAKDGTVVCIIAQCTVVLSLVLIYRYKYHSTEKDEALTANEKIKSKSSPEILSQAATESMDLSDVALIGTDSVQVPAIKFVLAAHSKVFKRMFYGASRESTHSSKEVKLEYSGTILRAIYALCCKNDPIVIQNLICSGRNLVELIAAARYFELPMVETVAIELAKSIFSENPSTACEVYNITSLDSWSGKIFSLALETIRDTPQVALMPLGATEGRGVTCLSSEKLAELMNDDKLGVKEIFMFKALKKWANTAGSHRDRFSLAKELVKNIDLLCIQASDIGSIVLESGLVQKEIVLKILVDDAVKREKANFKIDGYRCYQRKLIGDEWSRKRVEIMGAGTDFVNGIYTKDGSFGGPTKYSKKGKWENKNTTVYLWLCKNTWFLSIPFDNKPLTEKSSTHFYYCHNVDIMGTKHVVWNCIDGQLPRPQVKTKPSLA